MRLTSVVTNEQLGDVRVRGRPGNSEEQQDVGEQQGVSGARHEHLLREVRTHMSLKVGNIRKIRKFFY